MPHWETGAAEKRTAVELLVDELGPALRWAQATVRKTTRAGNGTPAPSASAAGPVDPPF